MRHVLLLGLLVAAPGLAQRPLGEGAPPAAEARYSAGVKAYADGRFMDAARAFQVAAELVPDNPRLAFNLGRALERAGRVEDAVRSYERYLQLTPDADDAEQVSAVIRSLRAILASNRVRVGVTSTPDGALVRVDGAAESIGRTPLVLRLAEGSHVVRLEREGYETVSRAFQVGTEGVRRRGPRGGRLVPRRRERGRRGGRGPRALRTRPARGDRRRRRAGQHLGDRGLRRGGRPAPDRRGARAVARALPMVRAGAGALLLVACVEVAALPPCEGDGDCGSTQRCEASACVEMPVTSACGFAYARDDACANCLAGSCCEEATACAGESSCAETHACYATCSARARGEAASRDCRAECDLLASGLADGAETAALQVCLSRSCADACTSGCGFTQDFQGAE